MSDIFISYSRKNIAFTQQLHQELQATKRDVWVDFEDLPPGARNFNDEIRSGIERSNAFIAVLSPAYFQSVYCLDELQYAIQINKKIIPVVFEKFPENVPPSGIASINWVYFCPHIGEVNDFKDAFANLIFALDTDFEHVREHTRLFTRAKEWDANQRSASFLLRGDDLVAAEQWLFSAVGKEPTPTQLHSEFLSKSRSEARRRQRRLLSAVTIALVLTLGLAALSTRLFQLAEQRRQEADENAAAAIAESHSRATQEAIAIQNLHDSWMSQSLIYADLSRQQREQNHQQLALHLALQSLAHYDEGIYSAEGVSALFQAIVMPAREIARFEHPIDNTPFEFRLIEDQNRLLAWSGYRLYIWDFHAQQLIQEIDVEGFLDNVLIDETHQMAVLNTGQLVNLITGDVYFEFESEGEVSLSPDGKKFFAYTGITDSTITDKIHVWDIQAGAEIQTLLSEKSLYGLQAQWGKDNNRIFLVNSEGLIQIWDVETGTTQVEFRFPFETTYSWYLVQWSHQEQFLAACDDEGSAYIIDSATGELRFQLDIPDDGCNQISWRPDDERLLVETLNEYSLWDSQTGKQIIQQEGSPLGFYYPGWSQDGSRLLTVRWNEVNVWDTQTGNLISTLTHDDNVISAQWSPEETYISTFDANSAYLWNAQSSYQLMSVANPSIFRILWTPDETRWIIVGESLTVWEVKSQQKIAALKHESGYIGAKYLDDDLNQIITIGDDFTIRQWLLQPPVQVPILRHNPSEYGVYGFQWSHDETLVLTWSNDDTARIWDANTHAELQRLTHASLDDGLTADHGVYGATWNQDDSQVMSWGVDDTIRIWASSTGENVLTLLHPEDVMSALWYDDETRILSRARDGVVRAWDAKSGELLYQFPTGRGGRYNNGRLIINSNETRFLTYSQDGIVRLGDLKTGAVLGIYPCDADLWDAQWSPNETRLFAHCEGDSFIGDGVAKVWDIDSGKLLSELTFTPNNMAEIDWYDENTLYIFWSELEGDLDEHLRWIDATTGQVIEAPYPLIDAAILEFSPNRHELLILDEGSTARVWDIVQQKMVLTLQHALPLRVASWNNDGSRIMTEDVNSTITIWDRPTGRQLLQAKTTLPVFQPDTIWNHSLTRVLAAFDKDSVINIPIEIPVLISVGRSQLVRDLTEAERIQFFLEISTP